MLGNVAGHHVREDGGADGLDPGRGFAFPLALQPLLLQRHQQPANKAIKALAKRSGLPLSEIFHFFQSEQGQSHLGNS